MVAYRSKVVERIELPARERRERALEEAGYNVFELPSEDVYIDLLTDSGTGAMSDAQWAALMRGDESYAGSRSFDELESAVAEVMGFSRVVPTHQGRGAENVLYGALLSDGDVVPNNTHFDTTRAHVANQGADPVDCPVAGARDPTADGEFKGNFSLERAREVVDDVGAERVPLVIQTITNNSAAGQPVSVENTRQVREFADRIDATFVIDACRFAENAAFVRRREDEFADYAIDEIAREQLRHADAVVMSGKKDGLANAGGFVATDDADLFERCKQRAILYEGFPTYGGMSGRDVAAMAVGLREAVEEGYVTDRLEEIQAFADLLEDAGVPVYTPPGGHAVYLDAGAALPHLDAADFPGQALVCELYREGGVRGVELGSFAFPDTDRPELVRLAVPRRTYHGEHFEHVADTAAAVLEKRESVSGLEVVSEPANPELRHFTAALAPLSD
ncbi:tryptophanase [Natronolimnohabitans innermongolicus]|uniref:Tryptophanase/L-cysteine desulfhydrase, PLP-dependent n=1 Tax=Natronolimnohabitans innermongolicus JCM 12255 TaxID=1227499 RepID=L9X390_9EURY|nr:tryptophanase [Natronolimnohabitans innermongolicus]ELY55028.1 tryptophanase/L-cysteine desulfhydrase, PLP-dependent [Natronolimnohabitans innermongolicus JCM 12255]